MKVILYELNEIPYKLFIDYIEKYRYSSMAKLIKNGYLIKTNCDEKGELHPWTSWPTLHMGVSSAKHNYRYLNQDKHTNILYPPIWDIAIKNKFTVGIFGLLQSKMRKDYEEKYKFFVPDTFNISNRCKPKELNSFQDLNTYFVSNLRRNKKTLNLEVFIILLKNLLSGNLTIKSLILIVRQLISEIIFKNFKFYRTIVQHDLSSILFNKLLKKYNPDFAAFFTNHLAASMHRYLKYTDLNKKFLTLPNLRKDSVLKGLNNADQQIGKLIKFAKKNGYEIILASSIGQETIKPSHYESYKIGNFEKFSNQINKGEYSVKLLPSMYPDYILKFESRKNLKDFLYKIEDIKTQENNKIFGYEYLNSGNLTLNLKIIFHSIKNELHENYNNLDLPQELIFEKKVYNLNDLGIEIFQRGDATAYHIPKGIICFSNFNKKTHNILKNNLGQKKVLDIKNVPKIIIDLLHA